MPKRTRNSNGHPSKGGRPHLSSPSTAVQNHAVSDAREQEGERIGDLLRQANDLEPRQQRVHVFVKSANPFQPPAGVLVKWSAWRTVIQKLQAGGFDEADLVIDETDGEVVHSPLLD